MIVVVVINCFFLGLEGNYFSQAVIENLEITNTFFNVIYILEFFVKIVGLGAVEYFTDFDNYLDLIVTGFSILDFVVLSNKTYKEINDCKKYII